VKIEIVTAQIVTAAITNEAVDSLKLSVCAPACAVMKSSDVMVAVD
jgi:molybdopterin-binding protein